jgi:glycosyltransferase involved in cell wall biosynthesis
VTIGLCVKDAEKTVGEALGSVGNQDFPHQSMELIIVDDGSKDKTLSIVKDAVSRTDIKTRTFSHAWKGLAFSRQIVVENAEGEYLVWVDADYALPNDFVRRHVSFMTSNPLVGVASGQEIVEGDTLVAFLESTSTLSDGPKNENVVDVGGAIYRLKVIEEVGGFDRELKGAGEDVELTNRIKRTNWRLSKSPARFYHKHRKNWKALWSEYFWWGYGMHYVFHKQGNRFVLINLPPLASFLALGRAFRLYRKLGSWKIFLLPFHSFFKYTAWCGGFVESHIDNHGH